MKVKLKLRPGNRGTKKLVNQYGDKLICVRYRYDETTQKRYKTVELIVDEIPWTLQPRLNNNKLLFVDWHEKELQEIVIPTVNFGIMRPARGITQSGYKYPTFRSCVKADCLSTTHPFNASLKAMAEHGATPENSGNSTTKQYRSWDLKPESEKSKYGYTFIS